MKLIIINALFATILFASFQAMADTSSQMNKNELASYISGRINLGLDNTSKEVKKYCDGSNCFVIVDR